jgi:hypothetical protein
VGSKRLCGKIVWEVCVAIWQASAVEIVRRQPQDIVKHSAVENRSKHRHCIVTHSKHNKASTLTSQD